MIGGGPIKGKAQELFKGQPVVDLVFEFGIGVDAEPLLKEHAFKEEQRRIGVSTFTAGTNGIVSHQDLFNANPVNGIIEIIHEFEAAVMFEGTSECQVSLPRRSGRSYWGQAQILILEILNVFLPAL